MDLTDTWSFQTATEALPPLVEVSETEANSGGARVVVRLAAPARVQMTVLDMAGKRVAVLPEMRLEKGRSVLQWNGRTGMGKNAAAGRYLARVLVRGEDGTSAQAVVMVRQGSEVRG
ncbi:MAG: FlgD immunoglobulin-like domain containing protein [Armatimonadia bacterium]